MHSYLCGVGQSKKKKTTKFIKTILPYLLILAAGTSIPNMVGAQCLSPDLYLPTTTSAQRHAVSGVCWTGNSKLPIGVTVLESVNVIPCDSLSLQLTTDSVAIIHPLSLILIRIVG